ncbi:MAG: hypothetical protein J7K23_03945 [Thermoproteales archaeon]|nr:hypothetical protein [Thermoproteales archaeon]
MKKKSYLLALIFSFILGFLLLDYGINNRGVMLSIVGATLILQGFSILIVAPLYKDDKNETTEIAEEIIGNYAYFLDNILINNNAINSKNIYIPYQNEVKILIMNAQKIVTIFKLPANKLYKNIMDRYNIEKYTNLESLIEDTEDILLENNIAKELKYIYSEGKEKLIIREPITLKYCSQIHKVSPTLFQLLGCPVSSTIVGIISRFKKTPITANFSLNNDTVEILFSSININKYQ